MSFDDDCRGADYRVELARRRTEKSMCETQPARFVGAERPEALAILDAPGDEAQT